MTTIGEKGAGRECLICPECLFVLDNAGRGRGFCSGQPDTRDHPPTEMQRYIREDVAALATTQETRDG